MESDVPVSSSVSKERSEVGRDERTKGRYRWRQLFGCAEGEIKMKVSARMSSSGELHLTGASMSSSEPEAVSTLSVTDASEGCHDRVRRVVERYVGLVHSSRRCWRSQTGESMVVAVWTGGSEGA